MANLVPDAITVHPCKVLLLLLMSAGGRGYPGGAPDMACESMEPTGHGAEALTSPSPYIVSVSQKSYKPGETLQVTVYSQGGEDYFRGMFVQARMIGCQLNATKTIGVFTAPDSELVTQHCFGEVHTAVSHNSAHRKIHKIFYWTAPVLPAGHVVMRATMVREIDQYWTNVESHLVADLHSDVLPRCLRTTTTTTTTIPTTVPTLTPSTTAVRQHRPPLYSNPYRPYSTTTRLPSPNQITTTGIAGQRENIFAVSQEQDFRAVTKVLTTIQEAEKRIAAKIPEASNKPDKSDGSDGSVETVDSTHNENGTISLTTDKFPAWLGPSFNRRDDHKHTTPEAGEKIPSWLIPAYQRAAFSSAQSLQCAGLSRGAPYTVYGGGFAVSTVFVWLRFRAIGL